MVQMEKFIHEKIFILEGDVIDNSIYMYLQGICKLGTMQRTKCGIPSSSQTVYLNDIDVSSS